LDDGQSGWYSDETATFGDRLAAAREKVGLSQEHFARKLGIKLKTVRAWENDLAEPRANKLQMMAGLLNVSIIWLLTGEGEGVAAPGDQDLPQDMAPLLLEMRSLRSDLTRTAERLALLEKRLRGMVQP
jgi:transcriptional regulator with XRE-family HTH domain